MDRNTFLDTVLKHYAGCYDIVRNPEGEGELAATAEFHEHGVGYMLIRKAEMWSADRHEYVWFYSVPHLTAEVYAKCYAEAFEAGIARVNPDSGHMSSAVVIIFICDRADEDALQKLTKERYRKDFKFGLNGWVVMRSAAAILEGEKVVVNRDGRNERTFLDSIMHPRKRNSGIRRFLSFIGKM